jgi:ABC-2 type transport system permease protein
VKGFGRAFADELRAVRGDRGALLVLVGAVLIYALFYPLPYLPEVLKEVPAVVVDADHSALSRQLVRMLDTHELIAVRHEVPTLAEAEALVRAGRAGGILAIPLDFERTIRRGGSATVGVYTDAAYFLVYRQALTGFAEAIGTLSAGIEIRRLEATGLSPAQARARRDPVPLLMRPLFNPAEGYASYIVPSVLVLILQQTLLIGIGLLAGTASERREETALASPLAGTLGRAAFYLSLYAIHTLLYFGAVVRLFGFPNYGRPATLAAFALPFLLAVIFLGLAASHLFHRRETAIQALLFTSLPAVFLAGFSWPPEAVPAWLHRVALLLPSTPGMAGFLRLDQMGATLSEVRGEWMTLWVLAIVYFLLAWLVAAHPRTARPGGPESRASEAAPGQ